MKKINNFIGLILIIVSIFCCAAMPIQVNAQEETELRTVMISVFVQSDANVAKNEYVDVYFVNSATGEEVKLNLKGDHKNYPFELPKGEYRIVNATLADRPEVAFQTSVSKLVVDDSENIYYTVALKSVLVSEENQDEVENSIKDFEQEKADRASQENLDLVLQALPGIAVMLWLIWGIIVLVYALRGRFCKDYLKAAFIKAKGKIIFHVFLGVTCGAILGMLVAGGSGFSWFAGIIGFGFPFGVFACAPVFFDTLKAREERRDVAPNDSTGDTVTVIIMLIIALIIGALLIPVVIVKDIIEIVKTYRNYKAGIQ